MAKFFRVPKIVEAVTFDEFVQYGRDNGGNVIDGMPWSFNYKGIPVTHDNDECYLLPGQNGSNIRFTKDDILVTNAIDENSTSFKVYSSEEFYSEFQECESLTQF